jgi:gliding motility-associated-like protein
LNIPTGFSPNGDGVNDYFFIENIERYPNALFKVFNRWGNLVYEKQNYDNSWNGDSNSKIITIGEVLTNGTYFYVLDLANDEDPIQGYIILRR